MLLDWALERGQQERKGVYLLSDEDEYVWYEDLQFDEVAEGAVAGKDVWLMTWQPRTDVELGVCGAWKGEGASGGDGGCE